MKIYKILAIINLIFIIISNITKKLIQNDLKLYNSKIGTLNGLSNLFLYVFVPIDIILFILSI